MDHGTGTILLHNMGVLSNMKSEVCDMKSALLDMSSALCNMGVYHLIRMRYDISCKIIHFSSTTHRLWDNTHMTSMKSV